MWDDIKDQKMKVLGKVLDTHPKTNEYPVKMIHFLFEMVAFLGPFFHFQGWVIAKKNGWCVPMLPGGTVECFAPETFAGANRERSQLPPGFDQFIVGKMQCLIRFIGNF